MFLLVQHISLQKIGLSGPTECIKLCYNCKNIKTLAEPIIKKSLIYVHKYWYNIRYQSDEYVSCQKWSYLLAAREKTKFNFQIIIYNNQIKFIWFSHIDEPYKSSDILSVIVPWINDYTWSHLTCWSIWLYNIWIFVAYMCN